jgi:hypothetical protein
MTMTSEKGTGEHTAQMDAQTMRSLKTMERSGSFARNGCQEPGASGAQKEVHKKVGAALEGEKEV